MIKFLDRSYLNCFLHSKWLKYVDSGSEGVFYYSQIDNMGYKLYFSNDGEYIRPDYVAEEIIKDDEVNIESFIFPRTLLVVNGYLYGYITRYVENNLFDSSMLNFFQKGVINYKALKEAYKVFKRDVNELSKKKIRIYDLPNNLIFDGKRLYAIDTSCYHYTDSKNLVQENLESLEMAMDVIFDILGIMSDNFIESREKKGMSVLQYIDYLEKRIEKYINEEVKQKKL